MSEINILHVRHSATLFVFGIVAKPHSSRLEALRRELQEAAFRPKSGGAGFARTYSSRPAPAWGAATVKR